MVTDEHVLHQINRLIEDNDLVAAEECCRNALDMHVGDGRLLRLKGIISYRKADFVSAISCLANANAKHGLAVEDWILLADSFLKTANYPRALEVLHQLVEVSPSCADGCGLLGLAYIKQARYDEAIRYLRQALLLDKDNFYARLYLGAAYRESGQHEYAVEQFHRALELQPDSLVACFMLGAAYHALDDIPMAIECYEGVLKKSPEHKECRKKLAAIYISMGQDAERKCDLMATEKAFRRVAELIPDEAISHNNLGLSLWRMGRVDEARNSYETALGLDGNNILCPSVFRSRAEIDQICRNLENAVGQYAAMKLQENPVDMAATGIYPHYSLMYLYHNRNIRPIKELFGRVFQRCFQPGCLAPDSGLVRVGFVVSEGHESVFLRLMWGIIRRLDTAEFDPVIICTQRGARIIASILRDDVPNLCVVPNRLDLMAEVIRNERFNALYHWEISTDPVNYFLPFYGLAPVQCTGFGVPATSGLSAVDYYFSSRLMESDDADKHYSETLIRADSLLAYMEHATDNHIGKTRDSFGFSEEQNLYLCLQQNGKIHPDFDEVISGILRRDRQGRVVLSRGLSGYQAQVLLERFNATMPDVVDRIVFMPRLSEEDYLALIGLGDVLLDPLYYGGAITTYDGLSMGKPVVTCPSEYMRSRQSSAIYRKMQVYDCIVENTDDYINTALSLAMDKDYYEFITQKIIDNSPLVFRDQDAIFDYENILRRICVS